MSINPIQERSSHPVAKAAICVAGSYCEPVVVLLGHTHGRELKRLFHAFPRGLLWCKKPADTAAVWFRAGGALSDGGVTAFHGGRAGKGLHGSDRRAGGAVKDRDLRLGAIRQGEVWKADGATAYSDDHLSEAQFHILVAPSDLSQHLVACARLLSQRVLFIAA